MIEIKRIAPHTALVFKDVRLRALQESPTAFSSTYARESLLPDEEWQRRAARWGGDENDAMFMAFEGGTVCGIVGSYVEPEQRERAQVVSMWVDPAYRRAGAGKKLIDSVAAWNRGGGVRELALLVTCVNTGAIAFYEGLGFVKTGVTAEYPNDRAIIEYEMMLPLDQRW